MAVALFPASQILTRTWVTPSAAPIKINKSIKLRPHVCISASAAGGAATTTERPRSTTQYLSFSPTMSGSTLYQVLGISTQASFQEIKTAYRKLARVCHPDVVSMDRKDMSADYFIKIHSAYSTLSDPQKRMDYDRSLSTVLRQRRSSRAYATASSSSPRRSNWESDQCW